jgi:hypothetical protein
MVRSSVSILAVTSASTRAGSAPGNTVVIVAKILVMVGSSCRPMDTSADIPADRITRSASITRRG